MASVYFYEIDTEHTLAKCDQDHIDLLLTSRATTPDRTAYILGQSDESPLPVMISEARRLISAGADVIVIPCNTAHYFYDGLCEAISVPVINIMVETVKYCVGKGMKKVGILATEGTVRSRTYERVCNEYGVEAGLSLRRVAEADKRDNLRRHQAGQTCGHGEVRKGRIRAARARAVTRLFSAVPSFRL